MPEVNTDWVWYQRDATKEYRSDAERAYAFIVNHFIPLLQHHNTPHEFVYCPVSDTSNIAVEKKYIDIAWLQIFKDAGFVEKQIPLKDAMAQADLKEALLAGSNMNKRWD